MFKKIVFSFQANFLVAVLSLLLVIITTKYLGAAGRGYLSIIATYLAIVQLITGIFGPGTLAFLIQKHSYNTIFFISNIWSLFISLFLTLILCLINLLAEDLALIFFLNAYLSSIFSINMRMLISEGKMKWYNSLLILQPILILIGLFYKGWLNFGVKEFLLFQFISCFFIVLISIYLLKSKIFLVIRLINLKSLLKEAFNKGAFNQLSVFTQLINYRFSFFFLEKFSGLKTVGIFSVLLSIANIVWLFSTSAGTIIGDEISKSNFEKAKSFKLFNQYLKISVLFTILILLGALILPSSFYIALLNIEFKSLKNYLLFFSPAILIFSFSKVLAFYFSSLGKVKILFFSSLSGIIPSLTAFWFVKHFDLYGVIISTTLSFLTTTAVLIYQYLMDRNHKILL